ncbi:MAG: Lrp/AsnC family transcriptional regulator [Sulfobacillus benefaciens]|uniref:Lrp/AsnC family transcriptional regulator n=1 Tax=Sulfobacillus benefaciens TaxID=453960 RepID=A0A2T2XHX2_9FIRM|nr:MAG: Lrp/AsnC family transcriptional regulator [Sulfobacillus benefaciens]
MAVLDEVDRVILKTLSENARASLQEIANTLGMSRATIHERLKKLNQQGYVRGYKADIDWPRLGYSVVAWVALQTEQGEASYHVLDDLGKIPEVESAYMVAGRFDCLVKLRATDHGHLQRLLFDHIGRIRGFHRAETMVVLSAPLENNVSRLLEESDPE